MGHEYLIKNGRTKEECYLKSIGTEKIRDVLLEYAYGQSLGEKKTKSRKREWIREEEKPKGQSVATWTEDETQAMYFGSVIEAQRVIDRWPVLKMAKATIISA